MLALPINQRAAPMAATTLQNETALVLEECSSHQRTIVLNGLSLNVKNTFIDGETTESEENDAKCRRLRRARTCVEKIVRFAPPEELEESFDALSTPRADAHPHAPDSFLDSYPESASMTSLCGFPITVKNTFIELKLFDSGCDVELNIHQGARTCRASFDSFSHRLSGDSDISTNGSDSDVSDLEGFADTPFDDSPLRDAPKRSFFPQDVQIVNAYCNVSISLAPQVPTQTLVPAMPPGDFSASTRCPQGAKCLFDSKIGSSIQLEEALQGSFGQWNQVESEADGKTTVILRNLPKGFSRDMVADLLNSQGFEKKFDFIYSPVKIRSMVTLGYSFVNFVSPEAAEDCRSKLDGLNAWDVPFEKPLSVTWSDSDQGFEANVGRHRNNPVMHDSVEDEFKAAIYSEGVRATFPLPTKPIKPPRA